ncbi:hypothetical protein M9H77_27308 [Catharanthus roseus]|uniref:Uncharacterized protein n=1 Tax=Catharanthus roseus TaxID=4058 RepID=A0ACC0ADS0_CATRO|nr:hypothetical protein M9H77_27308 [Catharanthus roseus]
MERTFTCEGELTGGNLLIIDLKVKGYPNLEERTNIPHPTSVLETLIPKLESSDEEQEHPKAQALRDYQLSRDRVRRAHMEPTRYGYSYIVSYAFVVASYVEEKEPLCSSDILKSYNRSLWLRAMDEENVLFR